jgi:ABC-2 type transport system permease protein
MTALTIAGVNLKRLTRDRVGLFFLFVFPIVLILLLGVSFGGDFTPRLGIASGSSGEFARDLISDVSEDSAVEIERVAGKQELVDAVQRGLLDAGIVIPARYDIELRGEGRTQVEYVSRPGDLSTALRTVVDSAVADQAARVRAARFAAARTDLDFQHALTHADAVAERVSGVDVSVRSLGGGSGDQDVGRFDLAAASQLVLFVFVNSLAGSVALIQSRQLGVSRRMLSTPTRVHTILLGEAAGRFSGAMAQGSFIIVAAALLFGVNWGDPVAATTLVVAFSLVGTGAAMLFGAMLSNEQQAGALVPLGLALAALGGCMVPLEVFSPTMRRIAHFTPHAWAVEGFTELIRRQAGLVDVFPEVAVLLGFAAALLGLASWRLHRSIVG